MTDSAKATSISVLSADEIALHNIATGVIELSQKMVDGGSISLPYPEALQRGLDKLAALKLLRGETPPTGVPDLLADWCRRPLATWGLVLEEGAIGDSDRLLDGQMPTRACENWAVANPDVEAELEERTFMAGLFAMCQAKGRENMYTEVRRFLIEHPVLDSLEYLHLQSDQGNSELGRHLATAYQVVSPVHTLDGCFVCCKRCGNLLVRQDKNRLACENERCQHWSTAEGRRIPKSQIAYWLRRGLRRYIADPGQTELQLFRAAQKRHLPCELWPGDDAYDLRITLPNGEIWAVDVKDWANPFLLARQVKPFRTNPPWTCAFFVFPDERRKQRADYLRAFQNHCAILDSRTQAMFVRSFLHRLDKKITETRYA